MTIRSLAGFAAPALALLAGCAELTPVTIPANATPAEAYCLRQRGTIEMRKVEGATKAFCSLPNGSVLDAEVFYRASGTAKP